VTDKRFFAAE
jgi:hypothetical protein